MNDIKENTNDKRNKTSVLRQLATLQTMTLEQLRDKWIDLYGNEAPKYKKRFLIKRLAHRIQELYYGGLSEQAKVHLSKVADNDPIARVKSKIPEERKAQESILTGTRFVRIWNDRRYEVIVRDSGFEFDGRIFRSLSAIAREITGTQWNGKIFFGLKKATTIKKGTRMLDNANATTDQQKILRCAIYTRKSHEDGLEQEFNSLDAQRESAEAYIESQRLLGWKALSNRYDDGGFSGGTMERPAIQRLLADLEEGLIDIIVVYKIDRLSRSLLDFTRMIEIFNEKGVSFVSVTQQISTTDSTGRMMLNILMTFAQYEREVIGERIRDKVAAAKRRGKYCGGPAVLGYDVDREKKKLTVNQSEAPLVLFIFRRYAQVGSAKKVAQELNEQGYKTKSWTTIKGKHRVGTEWNTAQVYRHLNNRLYIAEIAYKGENYPAEHEALIDRDTWDKVQGLLSENNRTKMSKARVKMVAPLNGVIRCGHCDSAMGSTYTNKGDRRYSYYICEKDTKRAVSRCPLKRVPAGDIENVVLSQLGAVFRTPTLVAKTYFAAREIEDEERNRLQKQKQHLEDSLRNLRQDALELMSPDNDDPDKASNLPLINQQAVDVTRQLANVSARFRILDNC